MISCIIGVRQFPVCGSKVVFDVVERSSAHVILKQSALLKRSLIFLAF